MLTSKLYSFWWIEGYRKSNSIPDGLTGRPPILTTHESSHHPIASIVFEKSYLVQLIRTYSQVKVAEVGKVLICIYALFDF